MSRYACVCAGGGEGGGRRGSGGLVAYACAYLCGGPDPALGFTDRGRLVSGGAGRQPSWQALMFLSTERRRNQPRPPPSPGWGLRPKRTERATALGLR